MKSNINSKKGWGCNSGGHKSERPHHAAAASAPTADVLAPGINVASNAAAKVFNDSAKCLDFGTAVVGPAQNHGKSGQESKKGKKKSSFVAATVAVAEKENACNGTGSLPRALRPSYSPLQHASAIAAVLPPNDDRHISNQGHNASSRCVVSNAANGSSKDASKTRRLGNPSPRSPR
mmetsp:Transcript_4224/g.9523  ORF Transcript_4224/g.9523 Transcript_4224/m.9523 type:complete len:177 (-) Transcript_4224:381-911(-)